MTAAFQACSFSSTRQFVHRCIDKEEVMAVDGQSSREVVVQ